MSPFVNIELGGDVYIEDNPLLQAIPDFVIPYSTLRRVRIKNNDQITSLPVINKRIIRSLEIDDNDGITNLNGLENAPIGAGPFANGEIYIHNNDNLTTLNGLSTDLSLTISVSLVNNDLLTNIDWMLNFSSGGLTLGDNDSLLSLSALSNYTGSNLEIYGNALFTDLDGLQNATSLGGLKIIGTNISSLDGLGANTSIVSLYIEDNPNITNLNVFDSLTSIGGPFQSNPFRIINNDNITSLDGFENVTTFVNGNFRVNDNYSLEDFCAFSDLISNGGLPSGYFVSNNLYNPNISDYGNGSCSTLSVSEFDKEPIKIHPNPSSDYIQIESEITIKELDIYNIQGQKVLSKMQEDKINIQHLSNGLYLVKMTDNQNRTQTIKFIKK